MRGANPNGAAPGLADLRHCNPAERTSHRSHTRHGKTPCSQLGTVSRMGMRRNVAVVLVVAGIAACASPSAKPKVLPSFSPAATSGGAPATALSTKTAAPPTPQGAVAFARYWYSQVELAYAKRDPMLIQRLSAPGCTACERYVRSISEARDKNQRVVGVMFHITLAEAPALIGGKARVDVIYDGPITHRYDSQGKEVHSERAVHNFEEQLDLVRSGSTWLVAEDAAV